MRSKQTAHEPKCHVSRVITLIDLLQISPDQIVDIALGRAPLLCQLDLQPLEKRLFKPYGHLTPFCLDDSILLVITVMMLGFFWQTSSKMWSIGVME